jgi:hypothetical protein
VATEILDHHPPGLRERWLSMVPAHRMAATYELKGVGNLEAVEWLLRASKKADFKTISRPTYSALRMRQVI